MRAEKQSVPQALLELVGGIYPQPFRSFKRCWEYGARDCHSDGCQHCVVFKLQIRECFTARHNQNRQCPISCHECRYFSEYYGLSMAFIHQISKPAAIYKDLYLWWGNRAWAEMWGLEVDELIGAGMEDFVHPGSLKTFIGYNKSLLQGDPVIPEGYRGTFNCKNGKKIEFYLTVTPLIRPGGSVWLLRKGRPDPFEKALKEKMFT